MPSLIDATSARAQNSLKCVGDPGGVTISQSRSSFLGFGGTFDRRVLIVGFDGEGFKIKFFRANGSFARSFSEAIHDGAIIESPLFGITPLPLNTSETSCKQMHMLGHDDINRHDQYPHEIEI